MKTPSQSPDEDDYYTEKEKGIVWFFKMRLKFWLFDIFGKKNNDKDKKDSGNL